MPATPTWNLTCPHRNATHAARAPAMASAALAALLTLLFIAPAAAAGAATPAAGPAAAASSDPQENLVSVSLNHQTVADNTLVLVAGQDVLVSGEDLARWRLKRPDGAAVAHDGVAYYRLSAIQGAAFHIEDATQQLVIQVPPEALEGNEFGNRAAARLAPVRSGAGGFINYDFFLSEGGGQDSRSGLFEGGWFNRYGVGVSTFVAQNIASSQSNFKRLESTWTMDDPDALTTWRLGDSINRTGLWGRAVRFGGIQYASNFTTQPNLVTTPLQAATGAAVVPSTVDVYVNHALVSQQAVEPGPFTITGLPAVNGRGEVQVVVRDVLGREQVVSQPFYASSALLREGLDDFSYEAGFVRDNFGLASADYGTPVAAATFRRGFTDSLTGEVHAEYEHETFTAGGGGSLLISSLGVVTAALAGSGGGQYNPLHPEEGKSGGLGLLILERQADPWSFNASGQWTSAGFRQVGLEGALPPIRQIALSASYSAGRLGSLGLAAVDQDNRDRADIRIYSATYSLSLSRFGFFSVTAVHSEPEGGATDDSLLLSYTLPLGERSSFNVSRQSDRSAGRSSSELTLGYQKNLPAGDGFGYHALWRDSDYAEAGVAYQNEVGTYLAEGARFDGKTVGRFEAAGGIALMDGHAFFTRQVTDSFGIVQVPGYAGIGVMLDNQVIARTDANGNALIPRLRAYDRNPVSIVAGDLPMDARVDTLLLDIAPYYRSGVVLPFPIARSNGAVVRLVLEDGSPLPAGALVRRLGAPETAEASPVALGGEAYVTDLEPRNTLRATWKGRSCDIDVSFNPGDDPLPTLGPYICKGVEP